MIVKLLSVGCMDSGSIPDWSTTFLTLIDSTMARYELKTHVVDAYQYKYNNESMDKIQRVVEFLGYRVVFGRPRTQNAPAWGELYQDKSTNTCIPFYEGSYLVIDDKKLISVVGEKSFESKYVKIKN